LKKLVLRLGSKKTQVWVGTGVLRQAGKLLRKVSSSQGPMKGWIIADARLKKESKTLKDSLEKEGWKIHLLYLKVSEDLKSSNGANRIYEELLRFQADRRSVLFALGGGVIGDLVGFVAGTYLRGIPWVGVPTTLLAQVDSSIGGKTGINHSKGKNLIGVFHQPAAVLCDLDVLRSLPQRDMISGLGEIIKYGLIFDSTLFSKLEKIYSPFHFSDPDLENLIARCLKWKCQTVEKDERDETGAREVLNFGHTLGHAIEAETQYKYYRHGEAVILGMRVAARLSYLRGYLPENTQERIDRFLRGLPVGSIPSQLKNKNLLERLKWDKKAVDGQVRFVLLRAIGSTVLDRQIQAKEISSALDWIRSRRMS
jgi:3-dehydroquinate synthase